MEPAQYFSLLVLLVCVIHIVATISSRVQPRRPASAKMSAQSTKDALAAAAPQRSDWYVFFHCSDLVGKEPLKNIETPVCHDRATARQNNRPSARRPQSRLILP